jgi:hypothetical protein
VRVDQRVSAVRAVEVAVFVCLRSSYRLMRLALKVVMQNNGDFMDVILLYLNIIGIQLERLAPVTCLIRAVAISGV